MNITINVLEASSELASIKVEEMMLERLKERLSVKHLSKQDLEKYIYVTDEDSMTYTIEAQDIFNDNYDMYFELLTNLQINND
jgi:hypothetical protein